MKIHCSACGSNAFRLSRFRISDVFRLLMLKYPVRCKDCRKRAYAFIGSIAGLQRSPGPRRSQPTLDRAE